MSLLSELNRYKFGDEIVFLGFVIGWPVIDMLNGFIRYYNISSLSISSFYKFFLLIFLFVRLRGRVGNLATIIGGGGIFCIVYHVFFHAVSLESISWLIRAFLSILIFEFLVKNKNKIVADYFVLAVSTWYFFIASANIFLGVIGIGAAQYSTGIGGKGFFIAGNELGYFLLLSAFLIIHILLKRLSTIIFFVVSFFLLFVFLIQGTKTSTLGYLVVFFLVLFGSEKDFCFNKKYLLLLFIAIIPLIYFAVSYSGALDRWETFFRRHGVVYLLFSGRDNFWRDASENLVFNFSALDFIFGVGGRAMSIHRVEIDPLDVFLTYGLLGVICFYLIFFYSIFLVHKSMFKGSRIVFGGAGFLWIAISIFAGHVVNSGICASLIAIYLFYVSSFVSGSDYCYAK